MRIEGLRPRTAEEKIKDSTPELRQITEELNAPLLSSDEEISPEALTECLKNFLKARSNIIGLEFHLGMAYDEQEVRDLKYPGAGSLASMSKTDLAKVLSAIITQVPNFVRLDLSIRKLEDNSSKATLRVWNSPSGELLDSPKVLITYYTDTWL